MLYILLFVAGWTVLSVWYFIANLGNKNEPEHWYDGLILFPALVIAIIIGMIVKVK